MSVKNSKKLALPVVATQINNTKTRRFVVESKDPAILQSFRMVQTSNQDIAKIIYGNDSHVYFGSNYPTKQLGVQFDINPITINGIRRDKETHMTGMVSDKYYAIEAHELDTIIREICLKGIDIETSYKITDYSQFEMKYLLKNHNNKAIRVNDIQAIELKVTHSYTGVHALTMALTIHRFFCTNSCATVSHRANRTVVHDGKFEENLVRGLEILTSMAGNVLDSEISLYSALDNVKFDNDTPIALPYRHKNNALRNFTDNGEQMSALDWELYAVQTDVGLAHNVIEQAKTRILHERVALDVPMTAFSVYQGINHSLHSSWNGLNTRERNVLDRKCKTYFGNLYVENFKERFVNL